MANIKETALTIFGRAFRVWYERTDRMWTIQEIDAAGNQVGSCLYAADRDMALVYVGIFAAR